MRFVAALFAGLLFLALSLPAAAERRVALVIGNQAYQSTLPLANPVSDANALSDALERLDFEVVRGIDLDLAGLRNAVREFSDNLPGSDIALFYYAGHGVQVNGRNYLLPVDANLQSEADLDFAAIDVDLVLRQMERHPAVKLVFLDACRNNPFEQALASAMGATRALGALGKGLAPIDARGGVMIGFATDPGAVAFDGVGENSPFTAALLRHIETPGLEVNVMMTRVRADVFAETAQRQRPWVTTSLLGEVYLSPESEVETPDVDASALELAFWQSIEGSEDPDEYQAYLDQFPGGVFASLAQGRLQVLSSLADDGPVVASNAPTLLDMVPRTNAPKTPEFAGSGPIDQRQRHEQFALARPNEPQAPDLPDPSVPLIATDPRLRQECPDCPAMIALAGGPFVMGSPRGEGESTERPQKVVALPPFWLSQFEITVGQFRAFVEDSGYRPKGGCYVWTKAGKMRKSGAASWEAPGYEITDRSPVACVNWADANRYVEWLNEKTPGNYRLASEAEFEYAARAGQSSAYFFGDPQNACAAVNAAADDSRFRWRNSTCTDGVRTVAAVGTFPQNAFGLGDMIGNLWEWTADCWSGSHKGAKGDGRARTGGSCESRVLRGGSWDDPLKNLRSAYRVGIPASRRQGNVGFRVAKTP